MRYTFIRLRGQILGWGIGLAALGLILVPFYDMFLEQQETFLEMIEGYPPEFMAFFGGDASAIATPEGYLGMYGFSLLPIIIGIFALIAGSGLIASDEESGRLDLVLALPVSRTALFLGRFLAFVGAAIAILALGWLGFSILLSNSSLDVSWGEMALPFFPVLAQALIFGALALMFSMLLPARRLAAMAAGIVMVTSYIVSSMGSLNEQLASIAKLLPYEYFQGGDAMNGLNLTWLLGLLAAATLFALIAWWRFLQRDIRVGGEGGWKLSTFSFPIWKTQQAVLEN
jgi:ABC-2 type transport system permease protein